jgi:hypothetical protein
MTGTKIFARSYKPATAIPPALEVDRSAVTDRTGIDP